MPRPKVINESIDLVGEAQANPEDNENTTTQTYRNPVTGELETEASNAETNP